MSSNFYDLPEDAREELIEMVKDTLEYYEGEVCDLHHEVFNTDYFIIGNDDAEDWLKKNYRVFKAIGTIQEYEKVNFGEVNTKLDTAESVCNMLVYVLGQELLSEVEAIQENWNETMDTEIKAAILSELEDL